jgi:O-antigen chain-terminating methyltransferase
VAEERLGDRIPRLERERQQADRVYNDALSALDRVLEPRVDLPHPPPPYDDAKLSAVNEAWNILPEGPPAIDSSLKGRLRAFVWRLVGPPLETQRQFNASLVDHLNRNVTPHGEAQKAIASTIATLADHLDRQLRLQAHLIQYLQTVTAYIDTRDRLHAAEAEVPMQGTAAVALDWLKRWDSMSAKEARAEARLAKLDEVRATAALAQQTSLSLKRDVERLLESARSPGEPGAAGEMRDRREMRTPAVDLDSFKYLAFEDAFRGSLEEIRRRLAEYVPKFAGASDVLDLGCGRGEFLELLRAAGIKARGLDLNHEMVEASKARGLDVIEGDALTYVESLPDDSLGGIFAAQVVEHLEPGYLAKLLEAALHKIRPGGAIVLETINPACWVAFFESYLRDLTHVRPLHPETLKHLLRSSGFHSVEIEYRSPVAEWDRLRSAPKPPGDLPPGVADLIDTFNEDMAKLNSRMFTFQDYAAIGRK